MRRRVTRIGRRTLLARVDRASASVIGQPVHAEIRRAIAVRLAGRADRVIDRAVRCGTLYSVERLHALRIAVKKLRYTLEIPAAVIGSSAGGRLALLKATQRRLGGLHDLQVLMGAIQSAAGTAVETPWGWSAMLDDLERDCRERHAEVISHLAALTDAASALKQDAWSLRSGRRAMAKAGAAARAGRSMTAARRGLSRSA
jgi:CHAD domain-containing protein